VVIVGGVAAVAVLVLVAVVLLGGSHRNRSSDTATVAAASDPSASVTSTTLDPDVPAWMQQGSVVPSTPETAPDAATVALAHQYLLIVQPANQALNDYESACGCPDHPSVAAARAAVPALKAAQETEVSQLTAMADAAPEPLATDLRALVAAKRPFIEDLRRIVALPAGTSDAEVAAELHALVLDQPYGQAEARQVRADLSLPSN
jgi:hypothetical protein